MRTSIASIFVLPIAALQIPSIFAPFYEPELESLISNETLIPDEHELLKRDGNCPTNYNSCSTLAAGYGGACCTSGSICTTDRAHNIACCPIGATCTGTLTLQTATTTRGAVLGTGTATTTTTTNSAAATTTTGSATYISNSYFPFPIIPTTYINSAACNSAYSACQANYAACTNDLQGNTFGVTIVAPNGAGVTVAPTAQNLGVASATSICSSLSSEACFGIASDSCAQFGTATTTGGSFIVGGTTNAAARPTIGCMAAAGVMAGVGLGIAGQMI